MQAMSFGESMIMYKMAKLPCTPMEELIYASKIVLKRLSGLAAKAEEAMCRAW